jgi:hypothetical protein
MLTLRIFNVFPWDDSDRASLRRLCSHVAIGVHQRSEPGRTLRDSEPRLSVRNRRISRPDPAETKGQVYRAQKRLGQIVGFRATPVPRQTSTSADGNSGDFVRGLAELFPATTVMYCAKTWLTPTPVFDCEPTNARDRLCYASEDRSSNQAILPLIAAAHDRHTEIGVKYAATMRPSKPLPAQRPLSLGNRRAGSEAVFWIAARGRGDHSGYLPFISSANCCINFSSSYRLVDEDLPSNCYDATGRSQACESGVLAETQIGAHPN